MSNKRKRYNPEFRAKVALAALKNEETTKDKSPESRQFCRARPG